MHNLFNKLHQLLSDISLCESCLGRQFAQLLTGTTNRYRGEALLTSLGLELHFDILNMNKTLADYESFLHLPFSIIKQSYEKIASVAEVQSLSENPLENEPAKKLDIIPESKTCYICQGLFEKKRLNELADLVCSHSKHYEFFSFLVGSKIPSSMVEREENIRTKYNLTFGESIKSDLNREIGKLIHIQPAFNEKNLNFDNPDIVFIVNMIENLIDVQNNPIFIYGKYNKLQRGIPQTVWYCNECWGKGCDKCNFTGRKHPDAVEEYILPEIIKVCKAKEGKFHGSGREDVDALMLGDGRPFVAQINEPKIRTIDLKQIETEINNKSKERVKITLIEMTDREKVRNIKNKSPSMSKHYKMGVLLPNPQKIDFSKLDNLVGLIEQQTPKRVLHRRANLTRTREVFKITGNQVDDKRIEVEIICSGGLYVKELIHGDDGRTKPSLSQILGNITLIVDYLDVLKVEDLKK